MSLYATNDRNLIIIGDSLYANSSNDSAYNYYQQAFRVYTINHQYDSCIIALNRMVDVKTKIKDYDNAEKLLLQADSLIYAYQLVASKVHVSTLRNTSELYRKLNLFEKGVGVLEKALTYWKACCEKDSMFLSIIYNDLGNIYYTYGKYAQSEKYYRNSFNIRIKYLDSLPEKVLTSYQRLAAVYNKIGSYDTAVVYYLKSIQLCKEFEHKIKPIVLGNSYRLLALCHYYASKHEESRKTAIQGIQFLSKENNLLYTSECADMYNTLGMNLRALGRYNKAIESYKQAIVIEEKIFGKDYLDLYGRYMNMGRVYYEQGDYIKAIDYQTITLNYYLNKLGKNHNYTARAYFNLGSSYLLGNDHKKAIELLQESYDIRLGLFQPENINVLISKIMLAQALNAAKEYERGDSLLQTALVSIEKQFGQINTYSHYIYKDLLLTLMEREKYIEAVPIGQTSLKLSKAIYGENSPENADIYLLLSDVYYGLKKPQQASQYVQLGLIEISTGFNDTSFLSNPDVNQFTIDTRGFDLLDLKIKILKEFYIEKPETSELIHQTSEINEQLLTRFLKDWNNEASTPAILEKMYPVYEQGIDFLIQQYNHTADINALYEGLIKSEKCKATTINLNVKNIEAKLYANIPDSILDTEENLKGEIETYYSLLLETNADSNQDKRSDYEKKLLSVKNQLSDLVQEIEVQYPDYYNLKYNFEPLNPKQIQNNITNNKVIVEYFWGANLYFTFLITKDTLVAVSNKITPKLTEAIKLYKKYLSDYKYLESDYKKAYNEFVGIATFLTNELFPNNILSLINNESSLIIIPDGELNNLSFDALITDSVKPESDNYKNLPYLIKKFNISYAYSASLLFKDLNLRKNKKGGYLAFAPNYHSTQLSDELALLNFKKFRDSPLPLTGTINEVNLVGDKLKGQVFTNNMATETQFKKLAPEHKILHLAMHALTDDENPMYSKLIFNNQDDSLNDGYLNVYEIYNMKFSADMAVLSACNTGYGKVVRGEGSMSLAHAFTYAGCPSIIMSLWRANDESAENVIVGFFTNLLQKKSKSAALRDTKLDYLKNADPLTAHPFFWANFVAIGDDSVIKFPGDEKWSMILYLSFFALILLIAIKIFR